MASPSDPIYEQQLERLQHLFIYRWWLTVIGLWLTAGSLSIWALRHEISLWREYFTWTAVRYALVYNRLAAFGLALCVGMTVALLIGQSRRILFGLSKYERRRLERRLQQIRQQGSSHPLWQRVCGREG